MVANSIFSSSEFFQHLLNQVFFDYECCLQKVISNSWWIWIQQRFVNLFAQYILLNRFRYSYSKYLLCNAMVDMVDMGRWHRAPNAMQIWKHCFISEDRREYITAYSWCGIHCFMTSSNAYILNSSNKEIWEVRHKSCLVLGKQFDCSAVRIFTPT